MTKVRDLVKRDLGVAIEGVVKVFDRAALAGEIREYVVTDKIEAELKRILDTFTLVSESLRHGGPARDVMGIWVSGFFGSGKSHFAKVLGHLLQNTPLEEGGHDRAIDAFVKHLSDTPRGRDIRLRLGEVKLNADVRTIAFEIRGRKPVNQPDSVGEVLLSEFYRYLGLAENLFIARLERRLQQRGLLDKLEKEYETVFRAPWRSQGGRDDLLTVRRRLTRLLPRVADSEFPDEKAAQRAVTDLLEQERITPEGIADELVAWVDGLKPPDGRVAHLVFVIDEMGTFIGDSAERIGELNSLAEMIGNKGKGKVWLVATSQQDLERVVDRTNFQPALVGRLNARFELKPHLVSDEIGKVVSERILKKQLSEEAPLRRLYQEHEGWLHQLADLKSTRRLGDLDEVSFLDAYPFLPHQIRLAQDIFEALSGLRISGGVRSMISVVMEALLKVADEEVGVLVGFDQVFDAVENDLLAQEDLGPAGVRALSEANERVAETPVEPGRVLKVLYLLQRAPWVPRVPETLAKLLVREVGTEIPPLRDAVGKTLDNLREAGYVGRDEATGEWKYLNEQERTLEQAIQEMVRPDGPKAISLAAIRRTSQQLCKEEVVTRKTLGGFAVVHGRANVQFSYGVRLDGEAIETGPDLEVHFLSPLAPGRGQEEAEIRRRNQAAGVRGRTVWWLARSEGLEPRLKRYEALVKVTGDKRFAEDAPDLTKQALSVKRKERDDLRDALRLALDKAFLSGKLYYGGQEVELEGAADLREPVARALAALIPNAFPRFALADRDLDFARQLKAILNPATKSLHAVAPDLALFDTQGSLQRESALISTVLEVLRDLDDEGVEPTGALLLDARERSGFQGFSRPPFGWPEELVRLVLAACFRAGAVYLESQGRGGTSPLYDYRGSDELFAKISVFRRLVFHAAETSLTIDQLKQAAKALVALGAGAVSESGNALAEAVRTVGARLEASLAEAVRYHEQGLPLPSEWLAAGAALTEPTTARDPTAVVLAFLAARSEWLALHQGLEALRGFVSAGRHRDYEASRRLAEVARVHPVPEDHERAAEVRRALDDMAVLIERREVVPRWRDYSEAHERAFAAYAAAYLEVYGQALSDAEAKLASVRAGTAYREAPADRRDAVVDNVFGEGRACHYPLLTLPTVGALLEASGRRSLTSLAQALVALPGYQAQVEAELRQLTAPPVGPEEKVHEWRAARLVGRRFKTVEEVDEVADELKAPIRKGFTVVVR